MRDAAIRVRRTRDVTLSSIPAWARWALVLPAAAAAYIAIQILVAIGNSLTGLPEFFEKAYSQLINSIVGPLAFVYVGATVAPRQHFAVALVLTVAHAIVNAVLVTAVLISGRHSDPAWVLVGACALGIAATIILCYQMRNAELKGNSGEPRALT